uniref:Uncharacterized protein n=1 Tax=Anguilla anguilla TaxID=7936 RepID=A0A0E9VPQ4_ANGAN
MWPTMRYLSSKL